MKRAVIVEDEPLSMMYLKSLLAEGFPELEVVGTAAGQNEALALIAAQQPELVFLDIELQTGTGIGVALGLSGTVPDIIFTTALDEQATNLLRTTGIPYIQKPIDYETLAGAIERLSVAGYAGFQETALGHLRRAMQQEGIPQALLVQAEKPQFLPIDDILFVEASGIQSNIHMRSGELVRTAQDLRELDIQLGRSGFFRAHIQALVNLRHISGVRSDTIQMIDGSRVPLSPKKAAALQEAMRR